jgi:uncharacterized protein with PIN domain
MTRQAEFRFFGRLLNLLAAAGGKAPISYRFRGNPAIKDSIEALGLPHTEVDLILVDGQAVDFDYRLQADDRVEVYPFGAVTEWPADHRLSPPLPENPAFILDVHLGKLTRRLRMLGFDCRYRNDYTDLRIIELALTEGLIILTRDRGLLKHARVRQGYLVGSGEADEQVLEVLNRFRLSRKIKPLYRCPCCNGLLQPVAKAEIIKRLLPKTAQYYQTFLQCQSCQQLYWQGSHYTKIERWIRGLIETED